MSPVPLSPPLENLTGIHPGLNPSLQREALVLLPNLSNPHFILHIIIEKIYNT
jgi:hypothetical protein